MPSKKKSNKNTEYDNFASMLGKVAKVSHDEIKAKLEAEKKAKKKTKKLANRS